jgi:DNA-binding response OmpR family regulator
MPKTLLLADGSVTIQRVVELTFAHEDVRVVAVSDGHRTIKWLDGERPDVVLVDVDLGEVDGYGVIQHLKKSPRLRTVPVLMLAGAFEPVDQDRARAAGCDGIIVKPFEPQHLVARVKELLSAAVGVGASVGARDPKPAPASYSGPADSPSLAILRAGATGRTREDDARQSRLESVPTRQEPGPTAFLRSTPGESMKAAAPEKLELPTRPVWDMSAHTPVQPVAPPPLPAAAPVVAAQAAPAKVSLASAFSALLAAEQSHQPAAPTPQPAVAVVSDASIEDAVRRVLARMTDDLVRRIVVDTAERLIREEIQKIKDIPE